MATHFVPDRIVIIYSVGYILFVSSIFLSALFRWLDRYDKLGYFFLANSIFGFLSDATLLNVLFKLIKKHSEIEN
jgi:hypothetical protein